MFAALRSECASGAGGSTGPAASSVRSTDAAQLTLVLRTRSSNSARVFSVDRAEDKRGLIGQVLPPAPDAQLCRRLAGNLINPWP